MSIITIEGFKVYDSPNHKSIIVNSDCITECMHIYNKYNLDGVAITTVHNYKLQEVNFLVKYPEINKISISDGIKNIDALHSLKKLKSLLISGKNRKIDFSHFLYLEKLSADWSGHFLNLKDCKLLDDLSLYKHNPKPKDCSHLSSLPWIKHLQIIQSTIKSLKELNDFNSLEKLSFYYCSKLEQLCCLEKSKKTLNSLLFDHCKSLFNLEYVTLFENLEVLAYHDSRTLPSINFIKKISSLKSFRFSGTDIINGDVSPCLGLEYTAFTNKRHFSHTMEQINAISEAKI